MREGDVAVIFILVEDVAGIGMALGAFAGNTERFFAVVAGPAGLAFFHRFHTGVVAVALLFEDFFMTLATISAVKTMTEGDFADGSGLQVDYVDKSSHPNSVQNRRQGEYHRDDH